MPSACVSDTGHLCVTTTTSRCELGILSTAICATICSPCVVAASVQRELVAEPNIVPVLTQHVLFTARSTGNHECHSHDNTETQQWHTQRHAQFEVTLTFLGGDQSLAELLVCFHPLKFPCRRHRQVRQRNKLAFLAFTAVFVCMCFVTCNSTHAHPFTHVSMPSFCPGLYTTHTHICIHTCIHTHTCMRTQTDLSGKIITANTAITTTPAATAAMCEREDVELAFACGRPPRLASSRFFTLGLRVGFSSCAVMMEHAVSNFYGISVRVQQQQRTHS